MNNAIILRHKEEIIISVYDILTNTNQTFGSSVDVDLIFPDRLANMNGYTFKTIATVQSPRMVHHEKDWKGPEKLFMEIVAKLQNASFWIRQPNTVEGFFTLMEKGVIDVLLNTQHFGGLVSMRKFYKPINTFDTNGFCALVPNPTRLSYLEFLLTPLDVYIWTFLVFSIATFAVVWKFYKRFYPSDRNLDSVGHFVLGMVAHFFLQTIPFRLNRPILVSVVQVFVFTMLIIGNAYQSLLISLISEPHYGKKIKTVDEMISRKYHFMVDMYAHAIMDESEIYSNMKTTKLEYNSLATDLSYEESAVRGVAFIVNCDFIELLNRTEKSKFNEFYFTLPQKFISTYEHILSSRYSPFNQILNNISLKIFETGIRQHWPILLNSSSNSLSRHDHSNEDNMLKLEDLHVLANSRSYPIVRNVKSMLRTKKTKRRNVIIMVTPATNPN